MAVESDRKLTQTHFTRRYLRLPKRGVTFPCFAALLLCATALAGCVTSPGGRSQLMVISPEAAIVESRKAYISTVQQLSRENRLLNDPLLADRVGVVTGRVVAEAVARYPHTAARPFPPWCPKCAG